MVPISQSPVSLKDATLGQIAEAISAKIGEKDLNHSEEELSAASENIKTAISRINYAWNLRNSPIFCLPDDLTLRIFEHLQSLAYENISKTHSKWWEWLRVMSACRAWWRISVGGSSLWENVYIIPKMPVSFLRSILNRAGGRMLAVSFRSRDRLSDGHLMTIEDTAAHRIKSFAIETTNSARQWEIANLSLFFAVPYPNLESLDLYNDAFHNSPSYEPDIDREDAFLPRLIALICTDQLKHLTLRHVKGWTPTRFGNLTHLTLFGYADGSALAVVVPANPALRNLRLESIKYRESYSYDPNRFVNLDGQTLELVRCERGVLSMFTLSSTCSLNITQTVPNSIENERGVLVFGCLPEDISEIRCLHGLEELRLSVTRTPGTRGWITVEQKTVGYSVPTSSTGSGLKPSVTFTLSYHYDSTTPPYGLSFRPRYLFPHSMPWDDVTRASFDGFYDRFKVRDEAIPKVLSNLRSLALRRCSSDSLVHFIVPDELGKLESLRLEDGLSDVGLWNALAKVLEVSSSAGLRLKDLEIVASGEPSATITPEQMERLGRCVRRLEVTKAPGYRPVVMTKCD